MPADPAVMIFRIFYPDPDFGLYVGTADDPRGEGSETAWVNRRERRGRREDGGGRTAEDGRQIGKVGRPLRGRPRVGREKAQEAQNRSRILSQSTELGHRGDWRILAPVEDGKLKLKKRRRRIAHGPPAR